MSWIAEFVRQLCYPGRRIFEIGNQRTELVDIQEEKLKPGF